MKIKLINSSLLVMLLLQLSIQSAFAQSDFINFQSVIRNGENKLLTNKLVTIRISLLNKSATGSIVYREIHIVSTNINGIATIQIGNGTSDIGKYDEIEWENSTLFIKVEYDQLNNENYLEIGTAQLLSVPYALSAKTAIKSQSLIDPYSAGDGIEIKNNKITNTRPDKDVKLTAGTGIKVSGSYPNWTIENTQASGGGTLYQAGEGIDITSNTITNTKPDRQIVLNAGNGINVNGIYPEYTISVSGTSSGLNPIDSTNLLIKGALQILSNNCDTTLNCLGARMLWLGNKAAFRAGWVGDDTTNGISHKIWDCDSIGLFSVAFGSNNLARGFQSFASGKNNRVTANNTFAAGEKNVVNGMNSVSFGTLNNNAGINSMTIGTNNTVLTSRYNSLLFGSTNTVSADNVLVGGSNNVVSGENSIALGYSNNVSSVSSIAIGSNNIVSGQIGGGFAFGINCVSNNHLSYSFGDHSTASGISSFAFGTNSNTNGKNGAFVFADYDLNDILATLDNQMTMKFQGGYRFFTNSNGTIGTKLDPNANAWSTISDSNRKENFIKSDGKYFLEKIATMRLGSWNYKEQNEKKYRHYGAMAQEIFSAFGSDILGTIGNDTTINSADMDGIMMIAIQELIKQNNEQSAQIQALQNKIVKLTTAQNQYNNVKKDRINNNELKKQNRLAKAKQIKNEKLKRKKEINKKQIQSKIKKLEKQLNQL